ncbi:NADH-quinone oxidoreductase subunit N [Candidatus Poribacteria bacterium]|nr:NADH-quinone oxidoreductase subunit N [Candidatus Poribacteria bacterium]
MNMLGNLDSIQYYVGDTLLLGLALLVVVIDLVGRGRAHGVTGVASLLSIAAVLTVVGVSPAVGDRLFYGMVRADSLARAFKLIIGACALLTLLVSLRTAEVSTRLRGEFFALILFATYGMFLMVSASNLLAAYLGIEMASISSYILAGFLARRTRSSEAAFKYVIYGSVASGVMLFGISLVFGMAGTVDIAVMGERLAAAPPIGVALALVLMFAGLGYKIASVPFHMWSPDVYEGSPLPVTAFLSVASKAAGFGLVLRFFRDGMGSPAAMATVDWPLLLALVSAVTMTVGNLAAFGQTNVKRLLAYSSIAHGGYLLMGVVAMGGARGSESQAAVLFYFLAYLFMNLGAFYVVLHLAAPGRLGSEEISAYRGLIRRSPLAAILMSMFLFSLIGLPPFAGFWGKLYLFKTVIDASLTSGGVNGHSFVWLVLLGLLNSAISLYYYFSVVKAMLLDDGDDTSRVAVNPLYAALLIVLMLPTLLLGFLTDVSVVEDQLTDAPAASVAKTPVP